MGCKDCPEPEKVPQHAISFKAWYAGGRTFEGGFEDWASLPEDGVLLIMVYFDDATKRICMGDDYYGAFKTSDGYWTIIHNSHLDNTTRYPSVHWKRGQWVSEAEIHAVLAAAQL